MPGNPVTHVKENRRIERASLTARKALCTPRLCRRYALISGCLLLTEYMTTLIDADTMTF